MFEIDLLTKTGLQKARQKINVDKKLKKQSIIFYSSNKSTDQESDKGTHVSGGISIFSLLIFSCLIAFFVFFGFFSDKNNLWIINFLTD